MHTCFQNQELRQVQLIQSQTESNQIRSRVRAYWEGGRAMFSWLHMWSGTVVQGPEYAFQTLVG